MQDTNTATEPGNNPNPSVGDPNDRPPATDTIADAAGSGELGDLNSRRFDDLALRPDETQAPGWLVRPELLDLLLEVAYERDRQLQLYPPEQDDTLTEFDWATRRQTYELRLANDVSAPAYNTTRDSLIKLAAICVAQLESIGRGHARLAASIGETVAEGKVAEYRDVVEQRTDRDGFRVTRVFVRSDLSSISVFIRTKDLAVSRSQLATMSEEGWRNVVRDAARPSLDKLTEREIFEADHLSLPKREAD